jgi:hypothetical protein
MSSSSRSDSSANLFWVLNWNWSSVASSGVRCVLFFFYSLPSVLKSTNTRLPVVALLWSHDLYISVNLYKIGLLRGEDK